MQNIVPAARLQNTPAIINAQEIMAFGTAMDIEKLGRVVNESITAFSITTNLPQSEVVEILSNVRVEMLDEVQEAVESLDGVEGVDTVRLSVAIEETIKAISATTSLDADEITSILTERSGTSVEDIVRRLHAKSRIGRTVHA